DGCTCRILDRNRDAALGATSLSRSVRTAVRNAARTDACLTQRSAHLDAQQLSLVFDAPAPAISPEPARPAAPGGGARLRSMFLGSEALHYRLRRARRRSIGFVIDDAGLTVSAPRWVTLRDIEAAIREKERWIRAKLVEWRDWRARRKLPSVLFAD